MDKEGEGRGSPAGTGQRYAIRVQGHLDPRWAAWFEGMTVSLEPDGVTRIEGACCDQPALHGILSRLRDLAIPLLSVEQVKETAESMTTAVFVNSGNFQQEVLKAEGPVLVDFFTPNCLECRRLEPVIHHLAQAFQGQAKICLLNVAEAPELAEQYRVMHSPTLVFFKAGQPVDTLLGYHDSERITDHLQQVLEA